MTDTVDFRIPKSVLYSHTTVIWFLIKVFVVRLTEGIVDWVLLYWKTSSGISLRFLDKGIASGMNLEDIVKRGVAKHFPVRAEFIYL